MMTRDDDDEGLVCDPRAKGFYQDATEHNRMVTRHLLRRQLLRSWFLQGIRVRIRVVIGFHF